MNKINLKDICYQLVETFKFAGDISLKLRNEGLRTQYKEDNTPVTNGDLEVNTILTKKISEITPDLPIISEESSQNKSEKNLSNFNEITNYLNQNNIKIEDISTEDGDLEDVFVQLTKH